MSIRLDQIPQEVVEAAAKNRYELGATGRRWDRLDDRMKDRERALTRYNIVAALAAWPGRATAYQAGRRQWWTSDDKPEGIILPLETSE